jgi:hypothetical protein
MPGTTPHGLPYPLPTEPVAEGAQAIRNLAEAADTRSLFRIADVVLAADTVAGVDLTAIPQDFRELVLYTWLRCLHTAPEINIIFTLNGDTGANYYQQHIQATGAAIVADGVTAAGGVPVTVPGAGSAVNCWRSDVWQFPNYRNGAFQRHFHGQGGHIGGNSFRIHQAWGVWGLQQAINRIRFYEPNGWALAAGSRATLYGVA